MFVSFLRTRFPKNLNEILKSPEETKSWVQCLKYLTTSLSYNTWLSYVFFQSNAFPFWGRFYFVSIFCVYVSNCWILATWKMPNQIGKAWCNVIQKVTTLPPNKDQNAAAVSSISIEQFSKLEKETQVPQILKRFYTFLCQF